MWRMTIPLPSAATAVVAAVVVAAVALLAGCGSGGGGTSDTGGGAGTEAAATPTKPPHTLPTPNGNRSDEPATSFHISAADCTALKRAAERQTGSRLSPYSEPSPPSSRCRLTGPRATIAVYLDAGHAAHQRYQNRMTEQNQFGAPDPGKIIHPVPKVGEPTYGNANASWVPDLGELFAVRGPRWLSVTYSADGVSKPEAKERAAELAILGFRLTAH